MIKKDEIQNVKRYKYNKKYKSVYYRLILGYYYDFWRRILPTRMPSNLLTLIGFLFEICSFIISFALSKGSTQKIPAWACIFNGISLHIFQTLSNIDRIRIPTTDYSPIHYFFNHACSAFITVLEIMKVTLSYNLGCHLDIFLFVVITASCFYISAWEEYNIHKFILGYLNGPDEGIFILTFAQILVPFYENQLRFLILYSTTRIMFIIFSSVVAVSCFLNVIIHSIKQPTRRIKKAIISLLPEVITILIFVALLFCYYDPVWTPYFTITQGFIIVYIGQLTVLAFITRRSSKKIINTSVYVMWILSSIPIVFSTINENEFYWAAFAIGMFVYMLYFDITILKTLSSILNTPIFAIHKNEIKSTSLPQRK